MYTKRNPCPRCRDSSAGDPRISTKLSVEAVAVATAGRQGAAIDLTGYWVSVLSEDWEFRMVAPDKGVFDTLPLNAEGRRVGNTWDPAKDEAAGEQCRAYGAGNIMRMPTRLHITWENDTTLAHRHRCRNPDSPASFWSGSGGNG